MKASVTEISLKSDSITIHNGGHGFRVTWEPTNPPKIEGNLYSLLGVLLERPDIYYARDGLQLVKVRFSDDVALTFFAGDGIVWIEELFAIKDTYVLTPSTQSV